MLEQTEGILENSEASLKATIDNFAKKQRDAAHYAAEQGHVGVLRLLLQTSKYQKKLALYIVDVHKYNIFMYENRRESRRL